MFQDEKAAKVKKKFFANRKKVAEIQHLIQPHFDTILF